MPVARLSLIAPEGFPMVRPGDNLGVLISATLEANNIELQDGDVLVVAQKVASKAEGRYAALADVTPSAQAMELAATTGKDPRLIELILSESARVVRHRPNLIIVEHRRGYVMANAGIDHSNVEQDGGERVLLLPEDPDATAEALRATLVGRHGRAVSVIISDSFGRAWRRGTLGVALGAAGLPSLLDLRGQPDLFGRPLEVTQTGFADEIAAAASLLMGQAAEGMPLVIVRGLSWTAPATPASALVRPPEEDLFR